MTYTPIDERTVQIARYIIETGETVRNAAGIFRISKSTVHKDLQERLPAINKSLFAEVRAVLDKNRAERHLRGGEATKIKYIKSKKLTNS